MKNTLVILILFLTALSCKKSDNNPNPVYNKNLSYSQMIDTLHIVFGKKYSVNLGTKLNYGDTIIFNSDQTIIENNRDTTLLFNVNYQIIASPDITSANPKDSFLVYRIFTNQSKSNLLLFAYSDTINLENTKRDTISAYSVKYSPIYYTSTYDYLFYPLN